MATRTIKKAIPSCYVGKDLVTELEGLILQKAADLEGGARGTPRRHYQVSMGDRSDGTLTVKSVDQLPLTPMPNDVANLTLWAYCHDEVGELYSIKISFATRGNIVPFSCYEVSLTADTASELVAGIASMIQASIDRRLYKGIIRKPASVTSVFCWFVPFFLLPIVATALLARNMYAASLACWLMYPLVAATWGACEMLPHCIFDNQDNKDRFDRIKWFVRALVVFIVFTVIGGSIVQYLKSSTMVEH